MYGKGGNQFLPARNTHYSRYLLLKEQREHLLKLRQDGKFQDHAVSSASQNRGLPKIKPASPYLSDLPDHSINNKKATTIKKKHFVPNESDINKLEECYRRICNEDVTSLKLLLKNRDQFGKPKIPLLIRYRNPTSHHMKKCFENNKQFPKKSPPYVPHSFVRSSTRRRRQISTEFNNSFSEPFAGKVYVNTSSAKQKSHDTKRELLLSTKPRHKNNIPPSNKKTEVAENSREISSCPVTEKMSQEEFSAITNNEQSVGGFSTDGSIETDNNNVVYENITSTEITPDQSQLSTEDRDPNAEIAANCAISLEVLDENGDKGAVVWHEQESNDSKEKNKNDSILNDSQTLAAQRKQEVKELLEECTEIARQVNELELQKD